MRHLAKMPDGTWVPTTDIVIIKEADDPRDTVVLYANRRIAVVNDAKPDQVAALIEAALQEARP